MVYQKRQENFFEQSAWVLFLVIGLLEILFGLGDMSKGIENDPAILISTTGKTPAELKAEDRLLYSAIDQQQKVIGQILLLSGAMLSVVSLTAFRGGAGWAWFTFWLIPLSMTFVVISSYNNRQPGQSLAPPFYSGSLFAVLTIVWLALSYRKYVPRGEDEKNLRTEASHPVRQKGE